MRAPARSRNYGVGSEFTQIENTLLWEKLDFVRQTEATRQATPDSVPLSTITTPP